MVTTSEVTALIAERLGLLAETPDQRRRLLADAGIPSSTLQRMLAGKNEPQASNLMKVARAAGVSLDWLTGLSDERIASLDRPLDLSAADAAQVAAKHGPVPSKALASMRRVALAESHEPAAAPIEDAAPATLPGPAGLVFVPVLNVTAAAGRGRFVTPDDLGDREMVGFREVWLRSIGLTPGRTHILWAVGDSMLPTIRDGDMLLVDRTIDSVTDNGIYIVVVAGAVVVKRLTIRTNGSVLLRSDNERYPEEVIPPDEVPRLIVEGRVRWVGGPI